jgi:hypothetical protein
MPGGGGYGLNYERALEKAISEHFPPNVLTVGPSGCDYPTIQPALDAAEALVARTVVGEDFSVLFVGGGFSGDLLGDTIVVVADSEVIYAFSDADNEIPAGAVRLDIVTGGDENIGGTNLFLAALATNQPELVCAMVESGDDLVVNVSGATSLVATDAVWSVVTSEDLLSDIGTANVFVMTGVERFTGTIPDGVTVVYLDDLAVYNVGLGENYPTLALAVAAITTAALPAVMKLANGDYQGDLTLPQNVVVLGEGAVIDGAIIGDETNYVDPGILASGGFVNTSNHIPGINKGGGGRAVDSRQPRGGNTLFDCPVPRPRYNPRNLLALVIDDANDSWTDNSSFDSVLGTGVTPLAYAASKFVPICFAPIPKSMVGGTPISATLLKAQIRQYGGEILCHTYSHYADHTGMPAGADPDVYETLGAIKYLEDEIGFPVRSGVWASPTNSGSETDLGCTFNATANTVVDADHTLIDGVMIEFNTIVGTTGITAGIPYYVINQTAGVFQIALSPDGDPVDITAAGTGANYTTSKFNIPRCAADSRRGLLNRSNFIAFRDWHHATLYPETEGSMDEYGPSPLPMISRLPAAGTYYIASLLSSTDKDVQAAELTRFIGQLANSKHMGAVLWWHSIKLDNNTTTPKDLKVTAFKALIDAIAAQVTAGLLDVVPFSHMYYTEPCASGEQPNWLANPGFEYCSTGTLTGVACTFENTGDTVTKTSHGLVNGTRIMFHDIVNGTPIAPGTVYVVAGATTHTFTLTLEGVAVEITADGSGLYTVPANLVFEGVNRPCGYIAGLSTAEIVAGTGMFHGGSRACRLYRNAASAAKVKHDKLNVVQGEQYELSWWQYAPTGSPTMAISLTYHDSTMAAWDMIGPVATTAWVQYRRWITIPKGCTSLSISFGVNTAGGVIFIDDLFFG